MLAERLREFRKDHRLTQQNLADVLKVDRTTYTFYETGTTQPSVKTICKLAKIYNVSVGYLIGTEKNNPELRRNQIDKLSTSTFRQSLDTDTIAYLEKNEQVLLVHYRLVGDEKKDQILDYIKQILIQQDKELNEADGF